LFTGAAAKNIAAISKNPFNRKSIPDMLAIDFQFR